MRSVDGPGITMSRLSCKELLERKVGKEVGKDWRNKHEGSYQTNVVEKWLCWKECKSVK